MRVEENTREARTTGISAEFRPSKFIFWVGLVTLFFFVGIGIYALVDGFLNFSPALSENDKKAARFAAIFFLAGGVPAAALILAYHRRFRLILSPDRVRVEGVFITKEIELNSISAAYWGTVALSFNSPAFGRSNAITLFSGRRKLRLDFTCFSQKAHTEMHDFFRNKPAADAPDSSGTIRPDFPAGKHRAPEK